jgi:hypothetical protein
MAPFWALLGLLGAFCSKRLLTLFTAEKQFVFLSWKFRCHVKATKAG